MYLPRAELPAKKKNNQNTTQQHLIWGGKPTGCVGRRVTEHPSLCPSTRLHPGQGDIAADGTREEAAYIHIKHMH